MIEVNAMSDERKISIKLNRFGQAKYLNDCILHEINRGNNKVTVNIVDSFSGSNVCAPISGIIDYHRQNGVKIHVNCPPSSYANHVRVYSPIIVEDNYPDISPFDKVFTFSTDEGVARIVSMYSLALRQGDELENGVIQSLEWCMNESIDNVLQHSMSKKGFVMAQLHKQNKSMSFCVFDTGIGIYNSLRQSKHAPQSPLAAIQLAMKERITRDERIGQGNGLWGLSQIIKETNGKLLISSGGARYEFVNGLETKISSGDFNLGTQQGTTMIDFQLDYSSPIDVTAALNGYNPLDLWAEQHENEKGEISLDIAKESYGTGTRKSAERVRNVVINLLKEQYTTVILDFVNVSMLSSSYADELIGKLIAVMGFSKFMQYIVLSNLNEFNSAIVNRSVGQRMAQIYMEKFINEDDDLSKLRLKLQNVL